MWCNNHLYTVQNTSSLQSKTSYPLNSFSQLLSPPPYPLATTNPHYFSRDLCIPDLSLVSSSLQSHGLQHARLLCPPLSPRVAQIHVHWVWWCYLTISSSATSSPLPSVFISMRVFSSESALIRWPKCCSFSTSPSNEHSGLISFRTDWFELLVVQGTLKSSPEPRIWNYQLLINCEMLKVLIYFTTFFHF